jgi:hypothetical protein
MTPTHLLDAAFDLARATAAVFRPNFSLMRVIERPSELIVRAL